MKSQGLSKNTTGRSDLPARERIQQTAHVLFYHDGIRATGIDRIIAEAGVTKVTFYRHFPSKTDLIKAFLEFRHSVWMEWFVDALNRRRSRGIDSLVLAMDEWFRGEGYRGCAFINAVVEVADTVPEAKEISRQHKLDMAQAIAALLPPSPHRKRDASAIAMAVDGAIVRAQMDESPDGALKSLKLLVRALCGYQPTDRKSRRNGGGGEV